jgi:hypothetical protein
MLISENNDYNIFHIFVFDIIKYYNSDIKEVYINDLNIDKEQLTQKWRYFVMKKLYSDVRYTINTNRNIIYHNSYNCWKFINYSIDNHILEIVNKINSKSHGEYILLNQRSINNRYLYDNETELPLEDYLRKFNFPFKCCNFENMTPEEQYEICSKALVFISVHGAGCTNLIFTPIDCPLIEINFRTNWYCDPVCDDHFHKIIDINDKCDGELTYSKEYHKADYHNLCYLIGKKYIEIDAIKYKGGFNDRNPINKKKVYINGKNLLNLINKI